MNTTVPNGNDDAIPNSGYKGVLSPPLPPFFSCTCAKLPPTCVSFLSHTPTTHLLVQTRMLLDVLYAEEECVVSCSYLHTGRQQCTYAHCIQLCTCTHTHTPHTTRTISSLCVCYSCTLLTLAQNNNTVGFEFESEENVIPFVRTSFLTRSEVRPAIFSPICSFLSTPTTHFVPRACLKCKIPTLTTKLLSTTLSATRRRQLE